MLLSSWRGYFFDANARAIVRSISLSSIFGSTLLVMPKKARERLILRGWLWSTSSSSGSSPVLLEPPHLSPTLDGCGQIPKAPLMSTLESENGPTGFPARPFSPKLQYPLAGAPSPQGQRSFPLPWRGLLLFPNGRVEYDRPPSSTIGKESTPLWNPVKTILEMHFFRWITFRGVLGGKAPHFSGLFAVLWCLSNSYDRDYGSVATIIHRSKLNGSIFNFWKLL